MVLGNSCGRMADSIKGSLCRETSKAKDYISGLMVIYTLGNSRIIYRMEKESIFHKRGTGCISGNLKRTNRVEKDCGNLVRKWL